MRHLAESSKYHLVQKPLITMKTVEEKGLNFSDLFFIYEHPFEYELDEELLELVEVRRKMRGMEINSNYKEDLKRII